VAPDNRSGDICLASGWSDTLAKIKRIADAISDTARRNIDTHNVSYHTTEGLLVGIPVCLCAFTLSVTAQILCASPTEVTLLPSPTTQVAKQIRTDLKHRPRPMFYNATSVTVDQIVALNRHLPTGVNASAAIRRSQTPISPYETRVFKVDGDLWRNMEGNDNEYHLEISGRDFDL